MFKIIHSNHTYGIRNFENKRYNEAIECFTKAIEKIKPYIRIKQIKIDNTPQIKYLHKLYVKLLYKRGYIYEKTNKKSFAFNDFETASDCAKENLSAKKSKFYYFSEMFYEFELYNKSLGICKAGLEINKNDYWSYVYKIRNDVMLKDTTNSSDNCLKKLRALNSKGRCNGDPDYFYGRGIAKKMLKKYKTAIEDYTKAIKLNPNDPKYFYNRGFCYENLGKYEKALIDYTKAIKLNPGNSSYLNVIGIVYEKLDEFTKAIECYTKAIKLNPNDPKYFHNRGVVHQNLGNHQKAIKDVSEAIKLNPMDLDYFYCRGLFYKMSKNFIRAINDFDQTIKLIDKESKYFHKIGLTKGQLKGGGGLEATKAYSECYKLENKKADCFYRIGCACENLGKYKEAIEYYGKAFELSDDEKLKKSCIEGHKSTVKKFGLLNKK